MFFTKEKKDASKNKKPRKEVRVGVDTKKPVKVMNELEDMDLEESDFQEDEEEEVEEEVGNGVVMEAV